LIIEGKEVFDIPGYEGRYAITKKGGVWSYPKACNQNRNGRWLSKRLGGSGYYSQILDGKSLKIHRILAMIFIPNPGNKLEVNHIDGIKTHNELDNLEWCTRSENMIHANITGLQKPVYGEKNGKSKLTIKEVSLIKKELEKGVFTRAIAKNFGVSQGTIMQIKNKKTWRNVQ